MSMCVKDVNATSVRIHLSRGKDRLLVRVPSLVGRVKSDLCRACQLKCYRPVIVRPGCLRSTFYYSLVF
jgi:hypothetical protein